VVVGSNAHTGAKEKERADLVSADGAFWVFGAVCARWGTLKRLSALSHLIMHASAVFDVACYAFSPHPPSPSILLPLGGGRGNNKQKKKKQWRLLHFIEGYLLAEVVLLSERLPPNRLRHIDRKRGTGGCESEERQASAAPANEQHATIPPTATAPRCWNAAEASSGLTMRATVPVVDASPNTPPLRLAGIICDGRCVWLAQASRVTFE
jgi:hypothetical protein